MVNHEQQENELDAIRNSVNRGSPFGDNEWIKRIAARLNLESTINPRGRPHKKQEKK
jgi:putative transposase